MTGEKLLRRMKFVLVVKSKLALMKYRNANCVAVMVTRWKFHGMRQLLPMVCLVGRCQDVLLKYVRSKGMGRTTRSAPTCGGNQAYDLSGDSDASEQPYDMVVGKGNNLDKPHLFMATNTKRSTVNHFLHILNIANVRDIASASQKIYDGTITAGYGVDRGIAYRLSDHRLFMIGGDTWETSHLLILKPL